MTSLLSARRHGRRLGLFAGTLLSASAASVQGGLAAPAAAANDRGGVGQQMESVVVTGTSRAQKKIGTPYAISTISKQNIREEAPHSVVDLLRSTPGIVAENSGGEGGGENVTVRGLPWAGFRLFDVLEDGVPLFESNYEREMQIDELFRIDLNTDRAEVVRGGTAPIYSNNASGGVLNLITNHGTPTAEHAVRVTGGSHGLARTDLETSGPINDRLSYAVGGFYRRDDGKRDPGFSNADTGGQIKLGASYRLHDESRIWGDLKYLNDRTIFYTSIPLVSPVDGSSLRSLIDPSYGTLASNSFRNVRIRTLDGSGGTDLLHRDLADGIHPETRTATLGGDFALGDGWHATDTMRYVNGAVRYNALNNGSPSSAASLLRGFAPMASAFPGVAGLRYVYAGTDTPWDANQTRGLAMTNTWQTAQINYNDFFNGFRLNKAINSASIGRHDLSVGVDVSRFSFAEAQLNNTIVTSVKDRPDLLDVQALDRSGRVIGNVTDHGFSNYGSGDLIGHETGVSAAVYASESWHITQKWQIDAGVRHETESVTGERGIIGTQTVSGTGPIAARTLTGLVGYQSYSRILSGTSWTAGTSYRIAEPVNVFARYTNSYSLPRLSDQWGNINNGVAGTLPDGRPVPTAGIRQAELGIKLAARGVQLSLIGFYSHFDDLNTSTYVANAAGLIVNQSLLIDTTTFGGEFEGSWHPVRWFRLDGSMTIQSPTVDRAATFNSSVSGASLAGKYITRDPRFYYSIQPSLLFTIDGMPAKFYAVFNGMGSRFQDYNNVSRLPAYVTIDLGALLTVRNRLDIDLHAHNLANSEGLTEGNARAPLSNALAVGNATVGRPVFGREFEASLTYRW